MAFQSSLSVTPGFRPLERVRRPRRLHLSQVPTAGEPRIPPKVLPANRTADHRREHCPVDNLRLPHDTGQLPQVSRVGEPRTKCRGPHRARKYQVRATGTGCNRGSLDPRKICPAHDAASGFGMSRVAWRWEWLTDKPRRVGFLASSGNESAIPAFPVVSCWALSRKLWFGFDES